MPVINDEEVFKYIYRTLQSKLVHVQYTAEKATRLRSKMSCAASENQRMAEGMSEFVNRIYSLRGRIKTKSRSLPVREKRYAKLVVNLLDDLMAHTTDMQDSVSRSAGLMDMSAGSLQLTVLKAVHYQWRERVYMSVLNKSNTIPAEDEHHCLLGRWYDGEGREKFGTLSAYIRLGEVHRKLHQVTAELAKEDMTRPGQERILKKLEEFESVSLAVISALDALDDSIVNPGKVDRPSVSRRD
ncbi:CZB domain-containing protein [Salmonella enterica]|nr:CZB domain-containing protein [Salmonella enterica]